MDEENVSYTMIPNELARNTSLSLEARGLAMYIATMPSGKSFSARKICRDNGVAFRVVLELMRQGYLVQEDNDELSFYSVQSVSRNSGELPY